MKTQCLWITDILYDPNEKKFFLNIKDLYYKHYIHDESEIIALFYACNVESFEHLKNKLAEKPIQIMFQFFETQQAIFQRELLSFYIPNTTNGVWYIIKTGKYLNGPLSALSNLT